MPTSASERFIYHIVAAEEWRDQRSNQPYEADSLASEGFIHCTGEVERLLWVAERFYREQPGDFFVLVINTDALQSPLRWEEADNHLFPHIYGPINMDAVAQIVPFPRGDSGAFLPPAGIA